MLDVAFERDDAIAPRDGEQFVHHDQQIEKVLLGRTGFRETCKLCDERLEDLGSRSNDERTNSGAADDDELGGLKQHKQMTAFHQEATHYGNCHNGKADQRRHCHSSLNARGALFRRSAKSA